MKVIRFDSGLLTQSVGSYDTKYSDTTISLPSTKVFFEVDLTAGNGITFGITQNKDIPSGYAFGAEGISWYVNGAVSVFRSVRFKNSTNILNQEDPKNSYPNGSTYGINISNTTVDL